MNCEQNTVIRVTLGPISETKGHDWFAADCPITRAFVDCKQRSRGRQAVYLSLEDMQKFVEEGVQIEYRGRRSKILDLLGAVKTDE